MTSSSSSHDEKPMQESNTDDPPPALPFVTTSDVLAKLNQNLQSLSEPGEAFQPRFELQKRLPDGSTIPASQSDLAASDLQTKLQQSAAFVNELEPAAKQQWAEQQRLVGNAYFQRGDYKTAMDVYLTCLVVKNTTTTTKDENDKGDSDTTNSGGFLTQTLIPVLNNLAQCTLQLGMYKKTIEFVQIALEEIQKGNEEAESDAANTIDSLVLCRLYFKRAKAQRLRGEYKEARQDLDQSQDYWQQERSKATDSSEEQPQQQQSQLAPYLQAIQKEYRHLETAEKQAQKNKQRQKKAMQNFLSSSPTKSPTKIQPGTSTTTTKATSTNASLSAAAAPPRQYSTLRKRNASSTKDTRQQSQEETTSSPTPSLSYWQYYWLVVARVAETLLVILGDEETTERMKKEVEQEEESSHQKWNRQSG